jgi:uncharacterized membrane protein YfcA
MLEEGTLMLIGK